MKKYILFDAYNIYFRALHTISERDIDLCKSMMLHMIFNMIKKACDKFSPDHIVVCCDGLGTWRKTEYPKYKANRIEKLQDRTVYEINRDNALKDLFENEFIPFLKTKTNVSVLQFQSAEADDLISRFIALHPNDNVVIVSTDNDFVQLLNDNVFIYNSMEDRLISNKCVMETIKNKPLKFTIKEGKISVPKDQNKLDDTHYQPTKDWVEYALFSKCIRGDKSDNIFSAYPGIREKSSKDKVGLREAFEDRNNKGFAWTTFMNSTWKDIEGKEHTVKDDYEFNKKLVDLNSIPEKFRVCIDDYIKSALITDNKAMVSFTLSAFLEKWNLVNLLKTISSFSGYFQKKYTGELSNQQEEIKVVVQPKNEEVDNILLKAFQ